MVPVIAACTGQLCAAEMWTDANAALCRSLWHAFKPCCSSLKVHVCKGKHYETTSGAVMWTALVFCCLVNNKCLVFIVQYFYTGQW